MGDDDPLLAEAVFTATHAMEKLRQLLHSGDEAAVDAGKFLSEVLGNHVSAFDCIARSVHEEADIALMKLLSTKAKGGRRNPAALRAELNLM